MNAIGFQLDAFDSFIFDMDGVIYLRDRPIDTAIEFINLISRKGKKILFLTNNSNFTVEYYRRKFAIMGIDISRPLVLTSSAATAKFLENNFQLKGRIAYLIGGEGLEEEIGKTRLRIIEGEKGKDADFIIVGWDTHLTYEKLKIACLAIQKGAHFIATNDDATYPSPEGLWPGAGSIVAALERASGRIATVVGKPNRYMMEIAFSLLGGKRSRTLMIGDRLETDILGAKRIRIKTCLVLTGVATKEELGRYRIKPDYVVENLLELV